MTLNSQTTEIPKVLIFKDLRFIDNAFKHLIEFTPDPREMVLVKNVRQVGHNFFCTVKCKKGEFTLERHNFWSVNLFKLIKKLEGTVDKSPVLEKLYKKY